MTPCPPILLVVCAVTCLLSSAAFAAGSLTLKHIHGLSFSADGSQLFIPSHDGVAIYTKDGWSAAPGPRHDYMGFAVTREFFYSSGHPAPGSPLHNPFGLIKSPDHGQTWRPLGLAGEADFISWQRVTTPTRCMCSMPRRTRACPNLVSTSRPMMASVGIRPRRPVYPGIASSVWPSTRPRHSWWL